MQILKNAFTESLKSGEFVAVNPAGTPVGRAGTREALEQAHAGTDVQILDATELAKLTPTLAEAATASLDGPFAAVVAQGVTAQEEFPVDANKKAPIKADPFDHDNSGAAGGSRKGAESTAHKGAEAKKAAAKK